MQGQTPEEYKGRGCVLQLLFDSDIQAINGIQGHRPADHMAAYEATQGFRLL